MTSYKFQVFSSKFLVFNLFHFFHFKLQIPILLCLLLAACSHRGSDINLRCRAYVDGLNREAFLSRYDDPGMTIERSKQALQYIDDSMPNYHDGRLRAWNNLARAYYNISLPDSSAIYADSVINCSVESNNLEIERLIAKLTHARERQRSCDIAGSYRLLYDVAQSDALKKHRDDILYNYAKSEYYVTLLSLNYHYRKGMQKDVQSLLNEAEEIAGSLKCDYAQDFVMNYALAYGHMSLCALHDHQEQNLKSALQYVLSSLELMSDSSRYSLLHFANMVQLTASIVSNKNIDCESWKACSPTLDSICSLIRLFGVDTDTLDLAMNLYIESSYMFEYYGDPYHTLGALVATGRLCLDDGDTAAAQSWFREAYRRHLESGLAAPKYESQLYDGLLKSKAALTIDEAELWAAQYIQLQNFIKQNEEKDFLLQTELINARRTISDYRLAAIIITFLALMLVVLAILLAVRTRVLRREKQMLQEMRRKDVERIANVETCLSVMRHDINPFISYLQNKNLPESLHQEVLSQLIRTFENIKNWTNLSIPSGLTFNAAECDVDEIFDEALAMNTKKEGVAVVMERNGLKLHGDRLLLIIMLRNLVANALQHTSEGEIRLQSNLYSDDSRFVELTVSDTGCGMTADEVENLFRTDKKLDQQAQHSGFGLILCRYIVKKHDDNTMRGCRIWAESIPAPTEGHGTKIHVCLQLAVSDK